MAERTKFVSLPLDVAAKFPHAVTFLAPAVSDDDTPVTYTWYHNGHRLVSDGVNVYMDAAGNLTILQTDENTLGEYMCVASNSISSVNATATLHLPTVPGSLLHTFISFSFHFGGGCGRVVSALG